MRLCISSTQLARWPRSRNSYDADDIDNAQIAIHCFTSDRPGEMPMRSCAVLEGTEAGSAKWSRQQHSAALG